MGVILWRVCVAQYMTYIRHRTDSVSTAAALGVGRCSSRCTCETRFMSTVQSHRPCPSFWRSRSPRKVQERASLQPWKASGLLDVEFAEVFLP